MYAIIFMFSLLLHNIEEGLWLVDWQNKHLPNIKRSQNHFLFSLLGITAMGLLASSLYILFPGIAIVTYLFYGFIMAMTLNCFFPHIAMSIYFRKYAPGTMTAVFLLLPLNTIILWTALHNSLITWYELLLSSLFMIIVLLLSIVIFEKIAKYIFN